MKNKLGTIDYLIIFLVLLLIINFIYRNNIDNRVEKNINILVDKIEAKEGIYQNSTGDTFSLTVKRKENNLIVQEIMINDYCFIRIINKQKKQYSRWKYRKISYEEKKIIIKKISLLIKNYSIFINKNKNELTN